MLKIEPGQGGAACQIKRPCAVLERPESDVLIPEDELHNVGLAHERIHIKLCNINLFTQYNMLTV